MSVKQMLKQLEGVQAIDLQILELRRTGDAHPARLAELDTLLSGFKARLDAQRQRLSENEQSRRTKETEIAEERDKVKKWETRLADQRTTREYSALAREIDIVAKHVQNMDLELKVLIGLVPEIKASIQAAEAEVQKCQESTSTERKELEAKLASFEKDLAVLGERRAMAVTGLDRSALARYDQVRSKRGTGLALVVGGVCKGCNLRLPPQLQNTLRAGASVLSCPSCSRYIYTPEMVSEPGEPA